MDNQRQDSPSQIDQVRWQPILSRHERQIFVDFTCIELSAVDFEIASGKDSLRGLADDRGEKDISVGDDAFERHGNPPGCLGL